MLLLLISVFNINYTTPKWGRLNSVFKVPKLPLEENSVVYLIGKPISYIAANSYKNVRFIFLYNGCWDGENPDFLPSDEYYKKLDTLIKDKKKYVIRRAYRYVPRHVPGETPEGKCILMQKEKYLNSKLKCTRIKDEVYNTEVSCMAENFDLCEYIE